MKIKVYVDFCDHEVMSENEFRQMQDAMIEEDFQNTRFFNDWLDTNYSCVDLFNLDPPDKQDIRESFHRYVESYIGEQITEDGNWEEFTIEV